MNDEATDNAKVGLINRAVSLTKQHVLSILSLHKTHTPFMVMCVTLLDHMSNNKVIMTFLLREVTHENLSVNVT